MASYDAFADIFHVLRAVPAILFALNGEGRVAMWNAESEAAFGVKASEPSGARWRSCGWGGMRRRSES